MNRVNSVLNEALSVLDNNVVSSVLGLFLVLYAGLAAPKLPRSVANLFDNTVFRVLVLFLVAYMSSKNKSVALIAAVGIVVSFQTLNRHKINDKIVNIMENEVEVDDINEEEIYPVNMGEIEEYETAAGNTVPVALPNQTYASVGEVRGYTEDEENISEVLGEESNLIGEESNLIGEESNLIGGNQETWGPAPVGEQSTHQEVAYQPEQEVEYQPEQEVRRRPKKAKGVKCESLQDSVSGFGGLEYAEI
jgi:hypothetical protein